MSKAAGIHKSNLKLALCLLGIIAVIAILISMRPLPSSNSAVAAPSNNMAAKKGGLEVSQAKFAAQTAMSVSSSTSDPQSVQNGPTDTSGNTSGQPSTPAMPPVDPDTPLYPIDPIPCKGISSIRNCGCEVYPDANGDFTPCWPKCPGRGVEMACAYPL